MVVDRAEPQAFRPDKSVKLKGVRSDSPLHAGGHPKADNRERRDGSCGLAVPSDRHPKQPVPV